MITNVYWASRKVPVIVVTFKWILNLLDRYSKYKQILNFVTIRPAGAELFHADGGTDGRRDMTKLIVTFRSFANTS